MQKIKIIWRILKNLTISQSSKEFFYFYLIKISKLDKMLKNRKYLLYTQGLLGSWCSRDFLFYAPISMEPQIHQIGKRVFKDKISIELYKIVFLRNIYSSHFIDGFEKYFDTDNEFNKKLKIIRKNIKSKVILKGNYFNVYSNNKNEYSLILKNNITYKLPINWFEISIFAYELGLPLLEKKYLEYIKNTNLIDVGAYIGDSSIVLSRYTNKKVIAIEPNLKNFNLLKKTIKLNGVDKKIDPYQIALNNKTEIIYLNDAGPGTRVEPKGIKVDSVTLDDLIVNKYTEIGLIKMDVEGFEMNILLGSKNIIKNNKPLLLISIYHTGDQFINIPQYFKKNFSNIYEFKFIDNNPLHPTAEKVFVCLPKI
jgi:FkbM family methyltransferase